ncbi:30S ribosomal protein S5 [Patescibacteria group bacterium]
MSRRENFRKKEPKEFFEEVAQIDRVTRVVKGGRRFRFRAVVVIGDRKGRVGFGVRKGNDVSEAIKSATNKAKKNIFKVTLTDFSIPHQVEGKFKGSDVLLKPAPEGRGIIAGGGVRVVMDVLGVKNVSAKIFGSTNKLNSIQATLVALKQLRSREEILRARGKEIKEKPEEKETLPTGRQEGKSEKVKPKEEKKEDKPTEKPKEKKSEDKSEKKKEKSIKKPKKK